MRAVFAVGVALRLVLALVNTDANDDHLAVIEIIAEQNRLPERTETFQAYHPPLYHLTAALLWKLAPTDSRAVLVRLAQLLNTAAGVWTLLAFRRLLLRSGVGERAAALAFALAALNPKLIAIQSQATNDAFVILFGALALEAAWGYFERPTRAGFWRMTVLAALGPLAKTNGVLITAAILATFALALLRASPGARRAVGATAAAFAVVSLAAPLLVGPYAGRWMREGSPFIANIPPSPPPDWVNESVHMRPGTTSVLQALGTFRLMGLLEQPQITNGEVDYPRHRTSLWTQVYARWHFAHYDNWPATWQTSAPALLWLGRLILLAALPVTALALLGLARRGWAILTAAARPGEIALVVASWGSLIFLAWFCLRFRDFGAMKAIYAFPALLGFVWALAWGLDQEVRKSIAARRFWTSLCVGLAALYAADAAWLSGHLLAAKLPLLLEAI